jgi:hypothetical protein
MLEPPEEMSGFNLAIKVKLSEDKQKFNPEKATRLTGKAIEALRGQRQLSSASLSAAKATIKYQLDYRVAATERASRAGQGRKGHKGPVTETIECICWELQENALEISPHVVLEILREDSFYGPLAEGARVKAGIAEPKESMVAELFEAGLVNIRIQEVIDSLEDENKATIRYRTRDGVADEFTFKRIRNLVSDYLNKRN